MKESILSVEEITLSFGGLLAVDRVSFDVEEKQVFSIIGPNGAGKTTVFNCISGFYYPDMGNISFNKFPIERLPSFSISRLGLVRTFQNIRLFSEMTVYENLLVAQDQKINTGLIQGILGLSGFKKSEKDALELAQKWLEFVGLSEFGNRVAGTLAYGQQRKLEIARCLATGAKMVLLDEPAAGLNPSETEELDQLIVEIRDQFGITVLLIEHDMGLVMNISDQILVLDQGRVIANGSPESVRNNQAVIKAYLGEE